MKFELKDYHQNITDEELILDLQQVATKLKQNYVTAKQQDTFGKYYSSTFLRRFVSVGKSSVSIRNYSNMFRYSHHIHLMYINNKILT
jgi:predicted class III extradiol MEMO1 family dioxygenase